MDVSALSLSEESKRPATAASRGRSATTMITSTSTAPKSPSGSPHHGSTAPEDASLSPTLTALSLESDAAAESIPPLPTQEMLPPPKSAVLLKRTGRYDRMLIFHPMHRLLMDLVDHERTSDRSDLMKYIVRFEDSLLQPMQIVDDVNDFGLHFSPTDGSVVDLLIAQRVSNLLSAVSMTSADPEVNTQLGVCLQSIAYQPIDLPPAKVEERLRAYVKLMSKEYELWRSAQDWFAVVNRNQLLARQQKLPPQRFFELLKIIAGFSAAKLQRKNATTELVTSMMSAPDSDTPRISKISSTDASLLGGSSSSSATTPSAEDGSDTSRRRGTSMSLFTKIKSAISDQKKSTLKSPMDILAPMRMATTGSVDLESSSATLPTSPATARVESKPSVASPRFIDDSAIDNELKAKMRMMQSKQRQFATMNASSMKSLQRMPSFQDPRDT